MPDDWKGKLDNELSRRILAAAVLLQGEHKRDLSKMNPPPHRTPSLPGQFPKARTLNLRNSVAVVQVNAYTVRVGYWKNAEYILALVKQRRLSVIDTAKRIRTRLMRIVRGGK